MKSHFYEEERSELYRLSEDVGERNDLTSSNPALSSELETRLEQSLEDASARFPTRQ